MPANNHHSQPGLSRIIFQALCEAAPEVVQNRHLMDLRLLQTLEAALRQKLVMREDGTSRLVIDLVLSRSIAEIRQALEQGSPLGAPLAEPSLPLAVASL